DRLGAPFEVDDREPPMRQPDPRLGPKPLAVWAAMSDRVAHGLQQAGIQRSVGVGVDDACNAAHRAKVPLEKVLEAALSAFRGGPESERTDPPREGLDPILGGSAPRKPLNGAPRSAHRVATAAFLPCFSRKWRAGPGRHL